MRVVPDANVLVSAVLSREGSPARLIEHWLDGDVDFIVCPQLLTEVERTLRAPKLRDRVAKEPAAEFVALVRARAELVPDPTDPPPIHAEDPGDDYLIALAARERAHIVSGDSHLLRMSGEIPVLSPRAALEMIRS